MKIIKKRRWQKPYQDIHYEYTIKSESPTTSMDLMKFLVEKKEQPEVRLTELKFLSIMRDRNRSFEDGMRAQAAGYYKPAKKIGPDLYYIEVICPSMD